MAFADRRLKARSTSLISYQVDVTSGPLFSRHPMMDQFATEFLTATDGSTAGQGHSMVRIPSHGVALVHSGEKLHVPATMYREPRRM